MQAIRYPLTFSFKITTLANDFTATDASGQVVAYVRQKLLKFKEHIEVYSDDSRSRVNYHIRADRWIDWSAAYAFTDHRGTALGKIARKGWKSLWKAEYELIDAQDKPQYHIREENGWVKVIDGLVGEIPVLGWFTGYVFNPSYLVTDLRDREIARLTKQPSFFGKEFKVEKLGQIDEDDDDRIMLGLMMMILLERRRG
ncbi:hypothetical protein LEM8419_01697 [Neolewinella maritima]|uniref:Uncharacterized protein n=1 Tax=Neolewinella maritima TaxID=1383882 RepID=A0ABM9B0P2_9BACT|nr:hypothetical protein [Neolewinella maritima]CAH1000563.1 hypothetical protein LEM8419_01697 [Neolewinella maritima]